MIQDYKNALAEIHVLSTKLDEAIVRIIDKDAEIERLLMLTIQQNREIEQLRVQLSAALQKLEWVRSALETKSMEEMLGT